MRLRGIEEEDILPGKKSKRPEDQNQIADRMQALSCALPSVRYIA